jgi:hypothetical protein
MTTSCDREPPRDAGTLFLGLKRSYQRAALAMRDGEPLRDAQWCCHFLRGDTVPVLARLSSSVASVMSR